MKIFRTKYNQFINKAISFVSNEPSNNKRQSIVNEPKTKYSLKSILFILLLSSTNVNALTEFCKKVQIRKLRIQETL